MCNTIVRTDILESVLTASGYSPDMAIQWAPILLQQARQSATDNALVSLLMRKLPKHQAQSIMAEMPQNVAVLCYARLVSFGMSEDEIKRLMPRKAVANLLASPASEDYE